MLLAFDIGNSGISFGVFDLNQEPTALRMQARISSDLKRSADEYIFFLRSILDIHQITASMIDCAAVSSVVPELTAVIAAAARFFCSNDPLIIGPGVRTGLNIRIDQQTQLGADIVANTVAALSLVPAPAVIVDLGTATTFAAVDQTSALIGTVICPGIRTSLNALASAASLLAGSDLIRPDFLIGKNTHDSVNSGVLNGHILMVDGFIRELRQNLCDDSEQKLSLIATGGLAEYVIPHCRNKFRMVPALTLCGVAEIFRRNSVR